MTSLSDVSAPYVDSLVRAHRQVVTADLEAWDDVWAVATALDSGEVVHSAAVTVQGKVFGFGPAIAPDVRAQILENYRAWREALAAAGHPVWRTVALHTHTRGTYELEFAHDGDDAAAQWLAWAQAGDEGAQLGQAVRLMPAG